MSYHETSAHIAQALRTMDQPAALRAVEHYRTVAQELSEAATNESARRLLRRCERVIDLGRITERDIQAIAHCWAGLGLAAGGSARHERGKDARNEAEHVAVVVWAGAPDYKMGETAEVIVRHLQARGYYVPTPKTVRKWLNEAARNGRLTIPQSAQKSGRPRK